MFCFLEVIEERIKKPKDPRGEKVEANGEMEMDWGGGVKGRREREG